jgi:hypothetical protein
MQISPNKAHSLTVVQGFDARHVPSGQIVVKDFGTIKNWPFHFTPTNKKDKKG